MKILVAICSRFAVWNIPGACVDRLRREGINIPGLPQIPGDGQRSQ